MKIGLFAINYGTCADPEAAVRVARHAEAAGFESVWTGEHVVLPDPAPRGFSMPATLPLLDTIAALTLIAAHTSTIKVASGIIVLPLRNPVILAKELASVDVISGGRLIAGFGAGYVSAEFAAAGVPMAGRGTRMEDYIRALRALWSMDRPAYQGRFVSFSGIDTRPRPHQRPAPDRPAGHQPRMPGSAGQCQSAKMPTGQTGVVALPGITWHLSAVSACRNGPKCQRANVPGRCSWRVPRTPLVATSRKAM